MKMRNLNNKEDLANMYVTGEVFCFYCSLTPHIIIYDNDIDDYKILNLDSCETVNVQVVLKREYDFQVFPRKNDDLYLVACVGTLKYDY
jgi:hypothetical protein